MDDNCGEWMECMGVASGCGEQEVGVVLRRYIDFLILLSLLLLYLYFFAAASLLFFSFFSSFFSRSCKI